MKGKKKAGKAPPKPRKTTAPARRFKPMTWIGLIALASLWMFVVGLLVGRGTSPLKFDVPAIENKISALIRDARQQEQQERQRVVEDLKRPEKTNPYKDLKADRVAGEAPAAHALKPEKQSLKASSKKKAPNDISARGNETPSAASTPPPAPSRASGYTVQVAAIKDFKTAAIMVRHLKSKGYDAFIPPPRNGDEGVLRVMVGRFTDQDSADKMRVKLKQDNIPGYVRNR